MPESSDWTTEFPAFRFGGGSIDELFERLETTYQWRWCGIEGIHNVKYIGGPDRGVGAKVLVVFDDDDPSTCEGEIVLSEQKAEGLTAAVEIRFTLVQTREAGSVLVRFDLAPHGDEVVYRCRLREEGDPGDAAVRALADRLRAILHWTNGSALRRSGHRIDWTIEASPEAIFEALLRPRRWNEWIARVTEGCVARLGTLPPPPEIPRLAFEPWSASGELDRSGAAIGDPDAIISAETPWRLIDPAGEGPAPTILLRTIDPGRSVEFMLVWRDAAALDPEAAELDPDEPRCHLRIDCCLLATDPPWVGLAVSSRCTPPQTQQRLGRLGTLLKWLSSTGCGKELTFEENSEVYDRLRTIHSDSYRSGRSFHSYVRSVVAPITCVYALSLTVVGFIIEVSIGRLSLIGSLLLGLVAGLSFVFARLIHELGHGIAMHLSNYRDDRMILFFPFGDLGGEDRGRHFNEPGWKAAVVALAGPLPGIALGVVGIAWCLFVTGPSPSWLPPEAVFGAFLASGAMLTINAYALLPVLPFDGGRVVQAVVASRLPWLDFGIFLLVSATLLAGWLLGPWRPHWELFVIGVVMALFLPSHFRKTRITARLLREGYRPVAGEDGRIAWTGWRNRRHSLGLLVDRIGKVWPRLASVRRSSPRRVAAMVVEQYERLSCRPPGLALSAVFLLAQFGAILLAVASLFVIMAARETRTVRSSAVAFSPDGEVLASGSWGDHTIRLRDTATGQPIGETLRGHPYGIWSVAFNPDGRVLAIGGGDGTIRLWDAATGQLIDETPRGHEREARSLAFSPDGRVFASGGGDNTIRLWDTATGHPIGDTLRVQEGWGWVEGLAFSPNGEVLASGGSREIHLWDAATGQPIGEPLRGHEDSVYRVAFSPDGEVLASGGGDGTIRLWSAATGQPIGEPLRGQEGRILGLAFSPDGEVLASGSWGDNTIRLWDTATGQPIGETLGGHEDSVYRVAFSPDGTTVAAANSSGVIHRWDVETGETISETRLHKSAEQWRGDTMAGLRRRFGIERQPPASATPN